MNYSLETIQLTKKFRKSKGIPTSSSMGPGHWIAALSLRFGKAKPEELVAVDHVDLRVRKGEVFGLLGPNGAGKTTLIKCISTLLLPDEGTAIVNGYDVVKDAKHVKTSISLVGSGQWVGFDWALTVKENLEFFANLYGLTQKEARGRVRDALELVGLREREDENPGKLSSGMRQKMVLAKGLLLDVPVFILDEPTVGLDPLSARDIRDYIKEDLSRRLGQTILLTTHYMKEAEDLCDKVAIMDKGRIIAMGVPEDLRRLVRKTEIVEIEGIGLSEELATEIEKIPSITRAILDIDDPITGAGRIRIHTDDVEASLDNVLEAMTRRHSKAVHVSTARPTLEDVFLEFTGRGLAA